MPITKQDPIKNMDTGEELKLIPATKRYTRAQAHRFLKSRDISHNPAATMEDMLTVMRMNEVAPQFISPGKMDGVPESTRELSNNDEKVKLSLTEDQLPNNVPKLRKMCKERGILFTSTDKMPVLKGRLLKV